MLDLSIVIPCYNSGKYLPETISSIKAFEGDIVYEIIIVDDGSKDEETLNLLDQLKQEGCIVIHQENKGPAAARNAGVRSARANYILFVDSDNKIRANSFISKGLEILNWNPDVGVFYGDPAFFGDVKEERLFEKGPFEMRRMLRCNYIDMCSIVRKQTWQDVKGLDENRLIVGHEDWDFWLRIARTEWKFYYHNETLFDYRVVSNSLVTQSLSSNKYEEMIWYILNKQSDLLPNYFTQLFFELKSVQSIRMKEASNPFRTFVKNILGKNSIKSLRV